MITQMDTAVLIYTAKCIVWKNSDPAKWEITRNSYLEESYNIFKEKFSVKDVQNQSMFLLLVHPGYNF